MATLVFDKNNKIMTVPAPDLTITCQEIYDQCRDYEDEPINLDIPSLVTGGGKDDIGGGEFTAVTITLLDNWRLAFEERAPSGWVSCSVTGGNLVAVNDYNNNPIYPTAFTQVQIRQSTAPAALEVETSGLTPTESSMLTGLFKAAMNNQVLTDTASGNFIIYDDDDVTPLYVFTVLDPDGNNIILPAGSPTQRERL